MGTYENIIISVSDGSTTADLRPFDLEVISGSLSERPTISGTPDTQVLEDQTYSFTPSFSDPDDESLSLSVTNLPAWASFDEATGTLAGTPANPHVGVYENIIISVTDGDSIVELAPFDIEVINVALTISGTPETVVPEDNPYSFSPTVSDAGDIVGFSIVNKPSWADFDSATGLLSGTPSNEDVGMDSGITISVSDGHEASSLASFSIQIDNVNDAPEFDDSNTPPDSIAANAAFSYTPTVTDVDTSSDGLTFSLANAPDWGGFSFDQATGELTATPDDTDIGDYNNIELTVDDGLAQDVLTFSVSVVESEQVLVSWNPPTTWEDGEALTINDLSGYTLEYYREGGDPDNPVVVGNDVLTYDLTSYETSYLPIGTWHFTLKAIATNGAESDPSAAADAVVDGNPG